MTTLDKTGIEAARNEFVHSTTKEQIERWAYKWADDLLSTADALSSLPAQAVGVKALDDDQIMEIIRECFPWRTEAKIYDLLTHEKSPPMIPQATYDVPSYRASKFVAAIETRILSALVAPSQPAAVGEDVNDAEV